MCIFGWLFGELLLVLYFGGVFNVGVCVFELLCDVFVCCVLDVVFIVLWFGFYVGVVVYVVWLVGMLFDVLVLYVF